MKDLSNGNKSLYLDIYRDGKRSYEYLKMYIIPETDDDARKRNQATLVAANAIKSQRIIAMTNGEAGIKKADDKPKVLLADWLQTYKERQKRRGRKDEPQINTAIRILTEMGCENMTMDDVDKKFCQNFIDYLRDGYKTRDGKNICTNTACTYYRALNGALNAAVREELLKINPFTRLGSSDKLKVPESKREYMTIDEVKKLIATPMENETVKDAYLFSCFCGLRFSDIKGLKWASIFCDSGQYRLQVVMQKTKAPIYLPLSSEALKWLPMRNDKGADEKVFSLPSNARVNDLIKPWAEAAGITKHFTFHTASHNKIFYRLNINELSISKNVTANDLETSYILFLSQLCNMQGTLRLRVQR